MSERETNHDNASGGDGGDASGSATTGDANSSGVTGTIHIGNRGTRTRSGRASGASGDSGNESSSSGSNSGSGSVSGSVSSDSESRSGQQSGSSSVSGGGSGGDSARGQAGAGDSNSSGSGYDTTSASGEPKKRRRRKRDAEGNFIPLDENDDRPTRVSLSRLSAGDDTSYDKGLVEDALGFVADGLFELVPRFVVPRQVLQAAPELWPLNEDERTALVRRGKALVNRMEKRNRAALMKRLDKWMPPIMLGVTIVALVQPRIQATQELIAELRRLYANANATNSTSQNGIATDRVNTTPPQNLGVAGNGNAGNGRARANPLDGQETL